MKYTAEQLATMSNNEIECAMHELIGDSQWRRHSYCSDWSATGPLMVEYGVSLQFQSCAYDHAFYSNDGVTIESSCNKNPLRAICEVILMMGNEK